MTSPISQRLAQVTAEIAALKRDRVTEKLATVLAVDEVLSTFTADVPGAVDPMEGISAPPQFLPAVGDLVRLQLVGAVPRYQPDRLAGGSGADALGLRRTDGSLHTRFDEEGQATLQALETIDGDPVFGGTPLSETLDPLATTVPVWGRGLVSGPTTSGTELGYYEVMVTLQKGRRYTIFTSGFRVDASTTPQQFEVRLRYTTVDGEAVPTTPAVTDTMLARSFADIGVSNGVGQAAPIQTLLVTPDGTGPVTYRFLLSMVRIVGSGTAFIRGNSLDPADIWFADGGPSTDATYTVNVGNGTAVNPTPKTYVFETPATWSATWTGADVKESTSYMYQGYEMANLGRGDYGHQYAACGFASFTGVLASATVTKIEVYLSARQWHENTGGVAVIGVHGHLSEPATVTLAQFDKVRATWTTKTGAKWVTLPSTVYAQFQTGSFRGITLGPAPNTAIGYLGSFYGDPTTKLRITYTA